MKDLPGHLRGTRPDGKQDRPTLMDQEYQEGLEFLRRACALWDGRVPPSPKEKADYKDGTEQIDWGEEEWAQMVARGMAREWLKHHRKAGEIGNNMLGGWRDAALDLEIAREGRPPAYPVDIDSRKERED